MLTETVGATIIRASATIPEWMWLSYWWDDANSSWRDRLANVWKIVQSNIASYTRLRNGRSNSRRG
jgi:hypothetical protein